MLGTNPVPVRVNATVAPATACVGLADRIDGIGLVCANAVDGQHK